MKRFAFRIWAGVICLLVGFISRYGIGDWQYWVTVAPIAFTIGWFVERETAR